MATIGKLNYIISANTASFVRAMVASRSEAATQRKILEQMRSPLDDWSDAQAKLVKMLYEGKLTTEQYNFAMQKLGEQHPQRIANANAEAEAARRSQEESRRLAMAVDSVTKRLQEQIATQGMSADQVELYRLQQQGATQEQLDSVAALQQQRAALEDAAGATARHAEQTRVMREEIGNAAGQLAVFGAAATAAFGMAANEAVTAAAAYETTSIAFTTLMGSADAARATLDSLSNFAATTPFQMPEVEQVARGLIMFGEQGRRMEQTLRILGDAAAGSGARFADLGMIYNQVRGVGVLLTQDFRQLSTRGVLSLQDIARYYGVADAAAQQMISSGQVGFEDLRSILQGLTAEGGRFANATVAQSQSMEGQLSTLKDNWGMMLRDIGTEMLPVTKAATAMGIEVVGAFRDADPVLKTFTATAIGAGAALGTIATGVSGAVFAGLKLQAAWTGMTTALTTLSATSTTATVALHGLTAAKYAAAGAGVALAAAAALYVGYNLGQTLYDQTEAGKRAIEVYDGLRSSLESIKTVDFTDTATADLEKYIASTEKQIAKIQQHNAELAAGQAWWNFWQANADLIGVNTEQVNALQESLRQAREQLTSQTPAAGPVEVGPSSDAIAAAEKYAAQLRQQNDLFGYTAEQVKIYEMQVAGIPPAIIAATAAEMQRAEALRASQAEADRQMEQFRRSQQAYQQQRESVARSIAEAREQAATLGMSRDQIELRKLAQQGATQAELDQLAAVQRQRAAMQGQLDAQAAAATRQQTLRDALQETTAKLREQAATAGMTAEQLELYRLAQLGATPEQLAQVAALQQQAAAQQAANQQQRDAIASTNQLQAATAGSSEAMQRVEDYRRMLAASMRTPGQLGSPAATQPGVAPQIAGNRMPQPVLVGPPIITEGPPRSPAATQPGVAPQIAGNRMPQPVLVGPPIITEGPPRSPRAESAAGSDGAQTAVLLGRAVTILQRIAAAVEQEPFVVQEAG